MQEEQKQEPSGLAFKRKEGDEQMVQIIGIPVDDDFMARVMGMVTIMNHDMHLDDFKFSGQCTAKIWHDMHAQWAQMKSNILPTKYIWLN